MKRLKISLGELKPNPYKKDIDGGRIDSNVVNQIIESANKTSFWEQFVVRQVEDEYQIAFGHHRLEAAVQMYGKKYEVSVQVEDYSDEQMLVALADENTGSEATMREQIDIVKLAKKYVTEHPESCKEYPSHSGTSIKGGDKKHEHGSLNCIVAFLGETNWSRSKIGRVIEAAEKLDPFVISRVAPIGTTHPGRQQMLSAKAAAEIGGIPDKAVQIAVTKEILSDKNELGLNDIKEIVEEAKETVEIKSKPTTRSNSKPFKERELPEPTQEELDRLKKLVEKVKESRERQTASQKQNSTNNTKILQFASSIIKEGRRALAAKYHPDKGGTTDDMVAVNAAEQLLTKLLRKESQNVS